MNQDLKLPESARILQGTDTKKAITVISILSVIAVLVLFWLIYFKPPASAEYMWVKNLSVLNASLNSLSAVFLLLGFREIKKKNFSRHMNFMLSAFITSSLFLVSYIVYHHFVGDSKFMGEGFVRPIYFFILITHIVLSVFVVPLALASFYFSLSGRFPTHRKVARWAFPIWMYVSVTGVLVFMMLKWFG